MGRFSQRRPVQPTLLISELPTWEKTLLAFEPTSRIVPTTRTRITANITAYSAISWPSSERRSSSKSRRVEYLAIESLEGGGRVVYVIAESPARPIPPA